MTYLSLVDIRYRALLSVPGFSLAMRVCTGTTPLLWSGVMKVYFWLVSCKNTTTSLSTTTLTSKGAGDLFPRPPELPLAMAGLNNVPTPSKSSFLFSDKISDFLNFLPS